MLAKQPTGTDLQKVKQIIDFILQWSDEGSWHGSSPTTPSTNPPVHCPRPSCRPFVHRERHRGKTIDGWRRLRHLMSSCHVSLPH